MSLAGILTIIFIFLRAFEVIDWSWWIVFSPLMIIGAIYLILLTVASIFGIKAKRKIDKEFKDFFK